MKPARTAILLSVLALLPACLENIAGPQNHPPQNEQPMAAMTSAYERREFLVQNEGYKRILLYFWMEPYAPLPENVKFPLLLILHGSGGNAYAGEYIAAHDMRLQYPAFVIVPAGAVNRVWAHADPANAQYEDLGDVMALLQHVAATYPVDPERVYVIGCSMGGTGAFAATDRYPGVFAAAVPMSGGWIPANAPEMVGTKFLIIHGLKDTMVPVEMSREMAVALRDAGAAVQYEEIPTMAHECPSSMLYGPEVWQWLFSQRLTMVE